VKFVTLAFSHSIPEILSSTASAINRIMRYGQWYFGLPQLGMTLQEEDIHLVARGLAGFAGLIGALGAWNLVISPFFIQKLPPMGFLMALPFVTMGSLCFALCVIAWAFAVLARRASIRLDLQDMKLCRDLHLHNGRVLSLFTPLSDIERLWVDQDPDSETSVPWQIALDVRGRKYPITLKNYANESTARKAAENLRLEIATTAGVILPS
jgi:hypothetical protein